MSGTLATVAELSGVNLLYGATKALDDIDLKIPAGAMIGFIGPDGVGKSSLLSLVAGARKIQTGQVFVLGEDMRSPRARAEICPRIAYMPQGLGRNLYADLSVSENIAFFGRLFGQARREWQARMDLLLWSTRLAPFADRPAKKLSGGMRQKLGLCCSLIHDPDLLILDEPTTGVDPLSRRQFWNLIANMRRDRAGLSVLVATAYMEEAERFDWLVAMDAGRVLATGTPTQLKSATGSATLEESFIALLPEERRRGRHEFSVPPLHRADGEPVIVARNLTMTFGDFTAVDHVSFSIERGEIFGFVGSNGCGKTTTMKMLTGLLPPTSGEALLFGQSVDAAAENARFRVGYMSQSFSLYTELTVRQNLDLHAHLFHIPPAAAAARIAELVEVFGLAAYLDQRAEALPLGIRQRLSLAVAIVHAPEILILDEPTSGVDPIARDQFWEHLIDLSRRQGVTIFISTHFMNEAARCDRIALMDAGRVLATDSPAGLVAARKAANLEEAFISYLEEAKGPEPVVVGLESGESLRVARRMSTFSTALGLRLRCLFACTIKESLELIRDPIRMGFALLGTTFLMLIQGFGISLDVNNLSFAVLDRDNSHESRAYLEELRGSSYYFTEKAPIADAEDMQRRLQTANISFAIEIPPGYGRDLKRGRPTTIAAYVDGAMPFRAQTVRGYLTGVHQQYLGDLAIENGTNPNAANPVTIETRFRYNQDFDSVFAMVPAIIPLLLILIPAILMALAVVREKEIGTITNLYVTPLGRLEFLLGKQIPYVAIGLVNFALLCLIAIFVFGVPIKGSFLTLLIGVTIYLIATTAYGMFISTFCKTQIAALFGTAILTFLPATQFSGMLTPVSSLAGAPFLMGRFFPMSYFLPISVGVFTKGLGFAALGGYILALLVFIPVFTGLSFLFLHKQES
ncbi:MAG: ribosome-associated ATPase/putative transporter RbbA [Beijerinckiaceae bacterium]